jgi:hypothetical protein
MLWLENEGFYGISNRPGTIMIVVAACLVDVSAVSPAASGREFRLFQITSRASVEPSGSVGAVIVRREKQANIPTISLFHRAVTGVALA